MLSTCSPLYGEWKKAAFEPPWIECLPAQRLAIRLCAGSGPHFAVVEACGDATLKVILEVAELESYDKIRAASFIAMRVIREGDFIKTSTGKASGSATLGNTQVMLEAILIGVSASSLAAVRARL